MDFVSQQHWDKAYRDFNYHVANDDLTGLFDKYQFLRTSGKSAFEFGCFPGRYLSYLGKLGWVVSGMDLTPGIGEPGFRSWLQGLGIKTGMLKQGDALAYASATEDKYDLVCSFGFIEHFEDFLSLIDLHDRVLKPGGHLLITTPNFRGSVQKALHKNLNARSLQIHYLPSMKPELWEKRLLEKNYSIEYAGYFGGFDFWYDEEKRSFVKKKILKMIGKLKPFFKNLPANEAYSPYCAIIAKKPES